MTGELQPPFPRLLPDWLKNQVEQQPDGIAVISHEADEPKTLTWRDLDALASDAVWHLHRAGIKRQERVGMLVYNDLISVQHIFGVLRLGAELIPLNTRLTVDEIEHLLVERGTLHLLVPSEEQATRFAGTVLKVTTALQHRWYALDFRFPVKTGGTLAVIHTSGTSGTPKGAVLTHGSVLAGAIASAKRIPVTAEDRWLCVLPLYHVGGLSLLFRAAYSGFTVDLYPRFDVERIDRALCNGDCTLISLVPTMLYRLLREGNPTQWRNLRFVLLGGAAASAELLALARENGVRVATTYGMTEAGSQVATALPDLAERKPGTVGKPLDGVEIRVLDENGAACAAGEYGEIVVRGAILMREYDNQPEATAASLRDGWYHTGDIGYLDEDGDLFLVQRRTDLIITGGENVYPAEVEAALRQHPDVEECAVVGVPDAEWGQRVAAAVVRRSGTDIDEQALVAFLRERLAGYKIPRLMRFVAALPLTASGKIERHRVQQLLTEPEE